MQKINEKYVPSEQIKANVWIATYQGNKYVVKEVPQKKENAMSEYELHKKIKIESQQTVFKEYTQCLCYATEFFEDQKSAYIVAPYFEYNLITYVKFKGFLSEDETRLILKNVCMALLYFHSQGMVYNDLKPANILIRIENSLPFAVLSDFGTITKEGTKTYLGTPIYSSPQMLANLEYITHDQKADVWSLGAVAYFALFGCNLFNNLDEISRSYQNGIKIPPERMLSLFALGFLEMCLQYTIEQRSISKDLITSPFLDIAKYPTIPYYARRLSMKPIILTTKDWKFQTKAILKSEKYNNLDLDLWEKCCMEINQINT